MINLGNVDGKEYVLTDSNGSDQVVLGTLSLNKDKEEIVLAIGHYNKIHYALDRFIRIKQNSKMAEINGNIDDLCRIVKESNDLRKQLLEKLG